MQARVLLFAFAVGVLAACGGSSTIRPTATTFGSPTPLTAVTSPTPASIATATETTLGTGSAVPCASTDLHAVTNGPQGATAMMSFWMVIGNVGAKPCALSAPTQVRFVRSGEVQPFAVSRPKTFGPLTLLPTTSPIANLSAAPTGQAAVWMIWTWRIDGPCNLLEPPQITVVADFPEGFSLTVPGEVKFGPCIGEFGIADFLLTPG